MNEFQESQEKSDGLPRRRTDEEVKASPAPIIQRDPDPVRPTKKEIKKETKPAKIEEEKYYRVKFHAKSKPDDDDNVVLSVQGRVLLIERDKEVVLPERYIVCAQNARYPQFRQMPNETRKQVGEVLVYPFEKLGPGTKEEYFDMKKKGTKATMEQLEKASFTQ